MNGWAFFFTVLGIVHATNQLFKLIDWIEK